ncbi:MAG: hypothetical protein CMP98_03825 [Gammaproteobacteria bacterium]|nr:hypothetical protein [Gammaproteobacteria bacterium]OUU10848.1 MAG: hypothetical protein CBB94_03940 [Gammaproteobacteria bacterium TMED34]|tara:strand:- start:724 stop:1350 length:627 start_codon:yes stop_codon:yes gene_type:complete
MIHDGLAPNSLEPDISLDRYLARLASNEAAPGGGAAAGVTGAQATSLMSMVCALSETSEDIQRISTIAEDARSRFLSLVNADITNFLSLMQLYQKPPGSTPMDQRKHQIQEALFAAATPPREMISLSVNLVEPLQSLHVNGNTNLVTDTGIATQLLIATISASQLNVQINLNSIKDESNRKTLSDTIKGAQTAITQLQNLVAAINHNL